MAGSSGEATVPGRRLGVVFYVTVAISAVFVVCGVVFTETFGGALAVVAGGITTGLGWTYMLI